MECSIHNQTHIYVYSHIDSEKVDKLVSIDAVRAPVTYPETISKRFRKAVDTLLKHETFIISGKGETPRSYEWFVKRHIEGTAGSLDEKACDVLFKRGLQQVDGGYVMRRDRRLLAAPLHYVGKGESLAQARDVTCHLLIIKTSWPFFDTEEDVLEQIEALKTKSKSFHLVEIEGPHHIHITQPERIAPMITKFFNS